jgi:hypothetical protein
MNSKPKYETWSAGNSQTFLYTEDRELAKFMATSVGKAGTTYDLNGRVYAWQFRLKTELVPLLVRKYSETHPLKNNDLQAAA